MSKNSKNMLCRRNCTVPPSGGWTDTRHDFAPQATPDSARQISHLTQFDRLHRLSSATGNVTDFRRSDLDNFHGRTHGLSRRTPTARWTIHSPTSIPHDLKIVISRGTPTSRPVLYKTTQQHLRSSSSVCGQSIQRRLKSVVYSKYKNIEIPLKITLAIYNKQTYRIERSILLIQKYKIINSAKQTKR